MEAAVKTFFSSPRFAVVGASSDPAKFGHKGISSTLLAKVLTPIVFAWYLTHSLPVTPINARASEVDVASKSYATVNGPAALEAPEQTSLSIITPPGITIKVLEEAKKAGIPAVWLQPGTFNDEVLAFARKEFKAAIAGTEGDSLQSNGHEGWCVLVDGEDGLKLADRAWKAQKL
jgi:predicted CoA-binding protein